MNKIEKKNLNNLLLYLNFKLYYVRVATDMTLISLKITRQISKTYLSIKLRKK
jgi:hypothetical protein